MSTLIENVKSLIEKHYSIALEANEIEKGLKILDDRLWPG